MTYSLERNGKFYIVEGVPARVDEETEEQFFAPKTLERLQKLILQRRKPARVIETQYMNTPSDLKRAPILTDALRAYVIAG